MAGPASPSNVRLAPVRIGNSPSNRSHYALSPGSIGSSGFRVISFHLGLNGKIRVQGYGAGLRDVATLLRGLKALY